MSEICHVISHIISELSHKSHTTNNVFYILQCSEITLEEAGKVLVPDYHDDTIYMALNPPVNPKSTV